MKTKKKKAFTLTELLVVVVVIGVLSAVVLPKFSKVIETRRTTEAEELMGAIRTEQEKRCALDKPYVTDFNKLTDIVKTENTKNYHFELASTGISAQRKDNYNYTLQMPSYADGRICCSGGDCEKLNKNYPLCDDLKRTSDYQTSPASCAGEVEPEIKECSGSATQKCGCNDKGTQTRTCNTTTGTWSAWSACSISDACECTGSQPKASDACNGCGTKTRTVTCNTATGQWQTGEWSACSKTEVECTECPDGKVYDASAGKCVCSPEEKSLCEFEEECADGSRIKGVWNEDTCACESGCPEPSDTPHKLVCGRVSYHTALQGSLVIDGQIPLSVEEARKACEVYGQDVSVYEAIMPSSDCPDDPRKPCTTLPGWGKHWTCTDREVECGVKSIGDCDPCTCICGVG